VSELAVGLMSGTSLDGIDAALVRIVAADSVELVAFRTECFGARERTAILEAVAEGSAHRLALLNVDLGRLMADAARALLDQAGVASSDVSFVASHGQTVWHEPGAATLQLGDPAVIAERLRLPVISDFRTRDVAAGGQGAPLVAIADALLFADPAHPRALLNIGGMANVTWVPAMGSLDGVIAFDTGPGTAVVDAVFRLVAPGAGFDEDGQLAARGTMVEDVVGELLDDAYFAAPPPKTTGRELFGDRYAELLARRVKAVRQDAREEDILATAVDLTARSIALGFERWLPPAGKRDVVVSGGGVRNPVLMRRLRAALISWPLRAFEDEFFDGDAKEAVAFAYLGWRTREGLTGNVPTATGAEGPRVLGRITPA
jgi:anhydro-N-acetylmuramic acid kinase